MDRHRNVILTLLLIGALGVMLMLALFVHHHLGEILWAVAGAKWGLAAVLAAHLLPVLCDTFAWRQLLPQNNQLSFLRILLLRWIDDSVSTVLPISTVGGEVVRARLAILWKMPTPLAVASVIVGVTLYMVTLIIFVLAGVLILLQLAGKTWVIRPVFWGALAALLICIAFYAAQRTGVIRNIGGLAKILLKSNKWRPLLHGAQNVDHEIDRLYHRRTALAICFAWTMGNWITGAFEVWIGLWALGVHAGFSKALALESVTQAIRGFIFFVPGGVGLQEAGYLAVGALLGINAQTALALAVIRRVRELVYGVPGVIAWEWIEGHHFFRPNSQRAPRAISSPHPSAPHAATSPAAQSPAANP